MYVYQGSIAIQGCTFDNNTASPGIGMGGAVMFDSTQLTSVTDTTMARGGFGQGQQLPECSAQYEHYAQCCCGGHTSSSLPSRPTLCSLPTGPCLPPGAGNVGFSGGAISAQLAGDVRLTRVRLIDNYSASFAGAALVWGSNLTIIDSDVSNVSVPMGVGGSFRCQNKQSEYSRSRAGHSVPVEADSAPRLCPALLSCRPAGLLPPPPALCPRPPPPPQNIAALFGGGIHAQYALYNATNTRHANNSAVWGGGGGLKLLSAVGLVRGCAFTGNSATYGGAIEVMVVEQQHQAAQIQVPTIISVNVRGAGLGGWLGGNKNAAIQCSCQDKLAAHSTPAVPAPLAALLLPGPSGFIHRWQCGHRQGRRLPHRIRRHRRLCQRDHRRQRGGAARRRRLVLQQPAAAHAGAVHADQQHGARGRRPVCAGALLVS